MGGTIHGDGGWRAGWVVSMVPGFVTGIAGDVDCFASFSCVETGFQAGNALRVSLRRVSFICNVSA